MYNHMLRIHGCHLATAQTLPCNTNAVGNGGARSVGGLLSGVEMVMIAASDVAIGASKSITLSMEDSADKITFTAVPVTCRRMASSSGQAWKKGDVIARLPVPSDCKEYIRVIIATDDASASGSVDVLFDYMPR